MQVAGGAGTAAGVGPGPPKIARARSGVNTLRDQAVSDHDVSRGKRIFPLKRTYHYKVRTGKVRPHRILDPRRVRTRSGIVYARSGK